MILHVLILHTTNNNIVGILLNLSMMCRSRQSVTMLCKSMRQESSTKAITARLTKSIKCMKVFFEGLWEDWHIKRVTVAK